MTLFRYTYCGGNGGLIIANTREVAIEKLEAKYGKAAVGNAEIWPWEMDDYYDPKNPDVLNLYDC